MAWSPQMQKWMKDADQHGMPVRIFVSRATRGTGPGSGPGGGGGGGGGGPPTPTPDEALLAENLVELLTQDQQNILLTDGFIDTEGLDPITTEGDADLII